MNVVRPYGVKCGVVRNGHACKLAAGHGTDHLGFGPCKYHGGRIPNVVAHQVQVMREFNARTQLAQLGQPVEANPEQALLDLVSQSSALVTFYGEQVQKLSEKEEQPGRFSTGYEQGSGLFGPKIAVDGMGTEHVIGEEARGMVILWNEERDRLAKYAKAALAAGIEKRRVEMAERHGEQIVVVINNVLVRLGISGDTLAQARTMIAAEFRQIQESEAQG